VRPNFTDIHDACVLYPAPLRDLLMRLALTDLYRARWMNMVHEEWTRRVCMAAANVEESAQNGRPEPEYEILVAHY